MVLIRACMNCGKEFNDEAKTGLCMPCEVMVRQVEKSEDLKELEDIWAGHQPRTPGGRVLAEIMQTNPKAFLAELRASQKAWREQVGRLKAGKVNERSPVEEAVKDGGTDRVDELIDRLLGGDSDG